MIMLGPLTELQKASNVDPLKIITDDVHMDEEQMASPRSIAKAESRCGSMPWNKRFVVLVVRVPHLSLIHI